MVKNILFAVVVSSILLTVWISDGFGAMLLSLVLLAMLVGSFLIATWQMAKRDFLFTFLALGEIKVVDSGEGNPVKVLANLPEGFSVNNMEIVERPKSKTWLESKFGLFWMGIPPASIHEFEFTHERINPSIGRDTPSSQWIERDDEPKKTKVLLWEIPHSYLITGVEFKDQFQADVLFQSRSRVVKPLTATHLRKGKFIDYMAEYVNAGVIEKLRQFDFLDFSQNIPKNDGSDLSKDMLKKINPELPNAVGLKMVGGFVSRFEATEEEKKALEAKKKAELEGQALVEAAAQATIRAGKEAEKLQVEAVAQQLADTTKALGQTAVLSTALDLMKAKYPNADDNTILHMATQFAITTKLSDPKSPVTAIGTGINIGVNQPERKS